MLGVWLVQCWVSQWCSDVGLASQVLIVITRLLYHPFILPPVYYTTWLAHYVCTLLIYLHTFLMQIQGEEDATQLGPTPSSSRTVLGLGPQ